MASPQSPCVDIFDDFDDAKSMETTYCNQVSEVEFQEDIKSETDKALGELCLYLDQNPEVYARVLRKRKQEEMESAGVVSYMKSKVMSLIHGEQYPQCLVTTSDCIQQTNALKAGMCKTFQYSQELKGNTTRHSARLAAKRQAQMSNSSDDEDHCKGSKRRKDQSKPSTISHSPDDSNSSTNTCSDVSSDGKQVGDSDKSFSGAAGDKISSRVATVIPSIKVGSSKSVQESSETAASDPNIGLCHSTKLISAVTCAVEMQTASAPHSLPIPPPPPPPPPLPSSIMSSAFKDTPSPQVAVLSVQMTQHHTKALTSITNTPAKKVAKQDTAGRSDDIKERRCSPRMHSGSVSRENSLSRARSTDNLSASSRTGSATSLDGPFLTPMVPARFRSHKRSLSNSSVGSASSHESFSSIHSELTKSNPITRLKATQMARSPGGTPVRAKTDALPSEPLHKAIFSAMKTKFKNVKTPSPRSGNTSVNASSDSTFTFSP